MAKLRVVEIKKTKTEKKAKSFDAKGYAPKAKKKKDTPPYAELLKLDTLFLKACELAGLPIIPKIAKATRKRSSSTIDHAAKGFSRQYGKWKSKRGLAYRFRNDATDKLKIVDRYNELVDNFLPKV